MAMSECEHDFEEVGVRFPVQGLSEPVPCDYPIELFPYTVQVHCMKCNERFVVDQDRNIMHNEER